MKLNKIITACVIVSLLGFPAKAIAEPLVIIHSPNIKVYAFEQVLNRWGDKEWDSFNRLVEKESQWISTAQNPNSTAYGIGQFLNSTWATVGCEKTTDKYKQVSCMIDYVAKRHGTPTKALQFHLRNNWY